MIRLFENMKRIGIQKQNDLLCYYVDRDTREFLSAPYELALARHDKSFLVTTSIVKSYLVLNKMTMDISSFFFFLWTFGR